MNMPPAIVPSIYGASWEVTKIAVGPSAPPMIAIEPASFGAKPKRIAPT